MNAAPPRSVIRSKSPDLRGLIWDLPTRIFHWSLVSGFFICYLSGEDDRLALLHITAGYMVAGLLLFRLIWGFVGSRHALFVNFVRGPCRVFDYLRALLRGHPPAYAGHNPLGAMAILLLLLIGTGASLSGILLLDDVSWPSLEWIHEWSAHLMLAIVVVHVLGVLTSSLLHRENLIKAMVTGRKSRFSRDAISHGHPRIALLMGLFILGFWIWSYKEKIIALI